MVQWLAALIRRTIQAALITVARALPSTKTVCGGPLKDAKAAYDTGDYADALRLYKPLAALGLVEAQFSLGIMYATGRGVTEDYKEAARLYGLAAAQGDALAAVLLKNLRVSV